MLCQYHRPPARIAAEHLTRDKPPTRVLPPLRWHQRLQVHLTLLFVLVFLLLGGGAWLATERLVQDELIKEVDRYASADSRRIVNALQSLSASTEQLATAMATLAITFGTDGAADAVPALLRDSPVHDYVHSAGLWPEPEGSQRRSRLWMRDGAGLLAPRPDYNDPDVIPYWRESWYTPAREAGTGQCYWTPVRRELLDGTLVVTCSAPIRRNGELLGVATVSLSRPAFRERFEEMAADGVGYALLADRENQLLAWTRNTDAVIPDRTNPPRHLAQLAQVRPEYRPLALRLHEARERFLSRAVASSRYDAARVSALVEATREMTRDQAESALAAIWNRKPGIPRELTPQLLENLLPTDPILDTEAKIYVSEVPGAFWYVIRVLPTNAGLAGIGEMMRLTVAITLATLALTLLLVHAGIRWVLIGPISRMASAVAGGAASDEASRQALDESPRNELGLLANAYNERLRQLAEQMERAEAANVLLASEVEERRKAAAAAAAARSSAELALSLVDDAVIVTDAGGRVTLFSPAAEKLTGLPADEAIGRPLGEVFQALLGADRAPLPDLAQVCMQRGRPLEYGRGVFLQSGPDEYTEIALRIAPLAGDRGALLGTVLVFRRRVAPQTATERAAAATRRPSSDTDRLTGLPGLAALEERLRPLVHAAQLTGERSGLIWLDVDHMAQVNGRFGYRAGDELLRTLAARIRAEVGGRGQVFRPGADSFAVVIAPAEATELLELADTIRSAVAATSLDWEGRTFEVTVSGGALLIDGSVSDAGEAVYRAMLACRRAKREERNRVCLFDPTKDSEKATRDDELWVRRIKAGLSENLFHLTTQYIAPSREHAAEGDPWEVFLTLEDEEGFWASPSEFLPVAERHHLSADIDRWVLAATLRHLHTNEGLREKLAFASVNLSGQSLVDPELLAQLVELLQKYPVPPDRLCLEITESTIAEHPGEADSFINGAKAVGCRIAIDAFEGRNLSDLELMRGLPVDFVKVDAMSFNRLHRDPLQRTVVESLLRVAHTLDKRVIVFNLDEPELVEAWNELGCDYVQGFLIAKPTPLLFTKP